MEAVQFIEIKPNNDKNINNSLLESINKLLTMSINNKSVGAWNDSIDDIYLDHNDSIIEHNKPDPINYINSIFKKNQNNNSNADSNINTNVDADVESNILYYDIISLDVNENKILNIMLIDKTINSTSYISSVDDSYRKNNFNLIASTLSKYSTNSSAVFGSTFILSINLPYYNILDKIDKIKEEQENREANGQNVSDEQFNISMNELIEKYTKQLNELSEIYYNFTSRHLIESFCNVCFVKIYAETNNCTQKNIYIYSRDLLENFVNNAKQIDIIKSNSIIKLLHENTIIYVKYSNPLPNSHYAVINMINNNETTKSDKNHKTNLYFINLTNSDIIFLQNQN